MLDHRHAVCYYSWFTEIFALNLKRWDEVRVETALTKALLGRCLACGQVAVAVAVAVAARAPAAAAAACSSSSSGSSRYIQAVADDDDDDHDDDEDDYDRLATSGSGQW